MYLRAQFALLEPNKSGRISFDNFRAVSSAKPSRALGELGVSGVDEFLY